MAQGSATVALTTAGGLIASAVKAAELGKLQISLLVVAIAAGATVLSHVNDSGVPPWGARAHTAFVRNYVAWRDARPGRWLVAGLAAAVAAYATAADRSAPVLPWLLLDLWLAHRIWKGGATALAWFRGLQGFALFSFGAVWVSGLWDGYVGTTAGPGPILMWGVSVWCLMSPALSRHVAPDRGAPKDDENFQSSVRHQGLEPRTR